MHVSLTPDRPAVPAKAYLMQKYAKNNHDGGGDNPDIEFKDGSQHLNDAGIKSSDGATPEFSIRKFVPPAAIGLCSGFLAGVFGVGGGVSK